MKTVQISLYSLSELSHEAKQKAIFDHKCFLDELPEEYENEEGELVEEIVNHDEDETIASIEANDYLFYANGELAHCVTYTGNHPKSGKTEFRIEGSVYELN